MYPLQSKYETVSHVVESLYMWHVYMQEHTMKVNFKTEITGNGPTLHGDLLHVPVARIAYYSSAIKKPHILTRNQNYTVTNTDPYRVCYKIISLKIYSNP